MLGQRNLVILVAAFLVGCAGFAPASSSDTDRKLSDAIERELPSLVSAGDYWTASKVSFQLAGARSRLNETGAACTALSNSLDYYRRALATDTDTTLYEFGTGPGIDEGMIEIRSTLGCVVERAAKPLRGHAPHPQVRETLISPIQQ